MSHIEDPLQHYRIETAAAYKELRNLLDKARYSNMDDELTIPNAMEFEEALGDLHNSILFLCSLEAKEAGIDHVLDHPRVKFDEISAFQIYNL